MLGLCTQVYTCKHQLIYNMFLSSGGKKSAKHPHKLCLYLYYEVLEQFFQRKLYCTICTAVAPFHCDYHRSGEDKHVLRLCSTAKNGVKSNYQQCQHYLIIRLAAWGGYCGCGGGYYFLSLSNHMPVFLMVKRLV